MLGVGVMESSSKSVAFQDRFSLTGDGERDSEQVSRLVSRWAGCTTFAAAKTEEPAFKSVLFGASYQQMAWVTNPTRSLLHSWGFSFSGGAYLVPSLALMGKLQFISSLPDTYGDLLDDLRSVRLMLGPAFAVGGEWWRLYIVPSAEAHLLAAFRTSRNPDCKFFLSDSAGFESNCRATDITEFPLTLQGGLNLALGGQLYFANLLFLDATFSVSTYFFPFDRSIDMNFPVALELGGGIAF